MLQQEVKFDDVIFGQIHQALSVSPVLQVVGLETNSSLEQPIFQFPMTY